MLKGIAKLRVRKVQKVPLPSALRILIALIFGLLLLSALEINYSTIVSDMIVIVYICPSTVGHHI
jgi:hypothetical protein